MKKQEESDKALAAKAARLPRLSRSSWKQEEGEEDSPGPVKAEQNEKAKSKKAADESAVKAKKAEEGFKSKLALVVGLETTKLAGEKALKAA